MKTEQVIRERSGNQCELCGEAEDLVVFSVLPQESASEENTVLISQKCVSQIEKTEKPEGDFWKSFLGESMWSEVPGVKVLSYRMLKRFRNESWAQELLDMLYMEEELQEWADALGDEDNEMEEITVHKDSNGNILENGDSVTLIKTLDVKGSSISAKIGTAVRNIRLVDGNPEQIEGKVEGQLIVILTKYVKKNS